MNTEEKINYLENKFDAPIDVILEVIRICKRDGINIEDVELEEVIDEK